MIRGATPRRGEEWLNSLPTYDETQHLDQYGLFVGVAAGIENPLIRLTESNLIIYGQGWTPDEHLANHWFFEKEEGTMELNYMPVEGLAAQIIAQTGIEGKTGRVGVTPSISTADIKFRLLPAEPTP